MAINTLSGKLATLDDLLTAHHTESTSAKSLYRYIGILDRVHTVVQENVDLVSYVGVEFGEKVLLTAQISAVENGVYLLVAAGEMKKVNHVLEPGNLVEDLSKASATVTEFWKSDGGNAWTNLPFVDGSI